MVFLTSAIISNTVTYWGAEDMGEFHREWLINWVHSFLIALPALIIARPLVAKIVAAIAEVPEDYN